MADKSNWSGFGWGLLAGAGGVYALMTAAGRGASAYNSRILRLERSIEIAGPVEDVFNAWQSLERLSDVISLVQHVRREGNRSHWVVSADGRTADFDAETTQFIPNQAIGWKSITGPKHSGRIHFAPLGNDTVVHVTMNYAPPLGRFNFLAAPATDHLESLIDRALREFKEHVESGRGETVERSHQSRQFSMTAPRQDEREGATRRDLLEADGALLENIRGGRQRVDRRRIESDKEAVYSPAAETDFGSAGTRPPHSGSGPESAGWDENSPVEQAQTSSPSGSGTSAERTTGGATASAEIAGRPDANPATFAPGENLFTRPPEDNYPTGMTEKERNDPYSAHGEKERGDKAS